MLQACETLTANPRLVQGDYGDLVKALKKVSLASIVCTSQLHMKSEVVPFGYIFFPNVPCVFLNNVLSDSVLNLLSILLSLKKYIKLLAVKL